MRFRATPVRPCFQDLLLYRVVLLRPWEALPHQAAYLPECQEVVLPHRAVVLPYSWVDLRECPAADHPHREVALGKF